MQILEFRSECSDVLYSVIEAMRGEIAQQDFLMHALAVGLGHMQEEVLNHHRQRTYEKLTSGSNQFNKAIELHKLTLLPGSPATPTPFGRDVTRPKAVG